MTRRRVERKGFWWCTAETNWFQWRIVKKKKKLKQLLEILVMLPTLTGLQSVWTEKANDLWRAAGSRFVLSPIWQNSIHIHQALILANGESTRSGPFQHHFSPDSSLKFSGIARKKRLSIETAWSALEKFHRSSNTNATLSLPSVSRVDTQGTPEHLCVT